VGMDKYIRLCTIHRFVILGGGDLYGL
jgi:hypothetical protein